MGAPTATRAAAARVRPARPSAARGAPLAGAAGYPGGGHAGRPGGAGRRRGPASAGSARWRGTGRAVCEPKVASAAGLVVEPVASASWGPCR